VFSAWSAQNRGGEGATYVVGANVTTGDVVWSMRVGTGYLGQVSLTQDGFALFGYGNASGVTCVHGDTGAVRWTSVLNASSVPVITVDDASQRAYVIPCACVCACAVSLVVLRECEKFAATDRTYLRRGTGPAQVVAMSAQTGTSRGVGSRWPCDMPHRCQ